MTRLDQLSSANLVRGLGQLGQFISILRKYLVDLIFVSTTSSCCPQPVVAPSDWKSVVAVTRGYGGLVVVSVERGMCPVGDRKPLTLEKSCDEASCCIVLLCNRPRSRKGRLFGALRRSTPMIFCSEGLW
jgi:hypothetical protein